MTSLKNGEHLKYFSFVIVGKSEQYKIWAWDVWSKVVPALEPLVAASRDKAAVRSVQTLSGSKKNIRFGRLGWDQKSHQKWAHGSELNRDTSPTWLFYFTEIWAPSWTVCERDPTPPELFVSIENPFILGHPRPGQFNQLFHFAVNEHIYHTRNDAVRQVIEGVASLIESVLIGVRVTPWNLRGDCIQDCLNNHVKYLGIEKDLVPDLSKMNSIPICSMNNSWSIYSLGSPLP